MNLSVIVPLYNEEESIHALHGAITDAVSGLGIDYEVLFVDDGSSDRTCELAGELADADPHLRVVKFRRNYGQTPAMTAGIEYAEGDVLVTMDGDLQNDPSDIPRMLEKLEEGYDIVVGWRVKRQDKLITRKIPSKIANWLIGKVTGIPIKDNGCSLKAFRSSVIKNVPLYSEMHRFIPAMASLAGARIAEMKVNHHPRRFGTSKYGLSRIYKVLLDLLTIKTLVSYTTRLFVWFSVLAAGCFLVSTAMAVLAVVTDADTLVVPVGVSMIFAAGGIFLLFAGVLSELIFYSSRFESERLPLLTLKKSSYRDR